MLIEKIIEFVFASLWITFLVICAGGIIVDFWFKNKKKYAKEIEHNTKNMGPFYSVTDEIISYNSKKDIKPLEQKDGECKILSPSSFKK